jgi:hypothetical protein
MAVLLVGIIGILITVMLHALATTILIAVLTSYSHHLLKRLGRSARPLMVATGACILALKHAVDIALWGVAFWMFGGPQFSDFDEAIYFSSVTYTTLGYGDVVISGRWRGLCGFEAIDGMILFGLSTALLFALVERLWLNTNNASP